VQHFRAKIFQYSWLMCGQREDAEEVSQETLLRVFERTSTSFASPSSCARGCCASQEFLSDETPQQPIRAHRGTLARRVHACARPRRRTRHVLDQALLRDVEDLSTDETAQVRDLNVDVIKARLHRARLAIGTST